MTALNRFEFYVYGFLFCQAAGTSNSADVVHDLLPTILTSGM